MKHSFKRALTLLLTAGMLLSAASLPAMAEEAPAGESQTAENPYLLPEDSPCIFIIDILDENDHLLQGKTIYYGKYILNEDPKIINSTSRDLVDVSKIKLRLSIRENVELYLARSVDLPQDQYFEDELKLFDGLSAWEAGAVSDVYELDSRSGDNNYFSIVYIIDGVTRVAEFSLASYEKGEFHIGATIEQSGKGGSYKTVYYMENLYNWKTDSDPFSSILSAEQLSAENHYINLRAENCVITSINGLRTEAIGYHYPLTGADTYLTLKYLVYGEEETGTHTAHLILCEEGKELWSNPFSDVKETDLFYNALSYCHRNGLLKGTSDTKFSPEEETNRAMIVTTLYRIAGSPDVTGENPFTDVPADQWYTNAVIWASQNGIVNGYDKEHFGPMDTITREQFAAILYRYAQKLYPDMKIEDVSRRMSAWNTLDDFSSEAADYAKEPLAAAAECGMIALRFDGFASDSKMMSFLPKNPVTRADLACGLFGLNRSLLVKAAASAQ